MDEGARRSTCHLLGRAQASDEARTRARAATKRSRALFAVHANRRERIERAGAAASSSPWACETPHRRHPVQPKAPILLERIDTYEPVIARAIEPKTQAEKESSTSARQARDEDPTSSSARTPRPAR